MSPAGLALQTLPPMVPRFWMAHAPTSRETAASAGRWSAISGERINSLYVVSAPMRSTPPFTESPRSSGSRQMSSTWPMRSSPTRALTATMKSVPPASTRRPAGL